MSFVKALSISLQPVQPQREVPLSVRQCHQLLTGDKMRAITVCLFAALVSLMPCKCMYF
jgi:hypothetical protein